MHSRNKSPFIIKSTSIKEVSIAHIVKKVDAQPIHPGLSLHRCKFGFLLFKNKIWCRGFPYRIPFKKVHL
jgi:hypothetical protein